MDAKQYEYQRLIHYYRTYGAIVGKEFHKCYDRHIAMKPKNPETDHQRLLSKELLQAYFDYWTITKKLIRLMIQEEELKGIFADKLAKALEMSFVTNEAKFKYFIKVNIGIGFGINILNGGILSRV